MLLGARADRAETPAPSHDSHHVHGHDHHDHASAYQTWTLERAQALSRSDLERFASGLGEHVYRAKGFVYLRDDPKRRYVYQQVGARWSLEAGAPWGAEPRRTLLVVIGRQGEANAPSLGAQRL